MRDHEPAYRTERRYQRWKQDRAWDKVRAERKARYTPQLTVEERMPALHEEALRINTQKNREREQAQRDRQEWLNGFHKCGGCKEQIPPERTYCLACRLDGMYK